MLEWFNSGCPCVKAAHAQGPPIDAAARRRVDGVLWLAIDSSASGKQGHGVAPSREGAGTLGIDHSILCDESGGGHGELAREPVLRQGDPDPEEREAYGREPPRPVPGLGGAADDRVRHRRHGHAGDRWR